MNSRAEQIVTAMEADFPQFQVWYVPRATQPTLYCARRWDGNDEVLNADDPDRLAGLIEQDGED